MSLLNKKKNVTKEAAEKKAETKIIVFTGSEKGIFAYHTALAVQTCNMARNVLVIDNSLKQDLFNACPHVGRIGSIGRATILSARQYTKEALQYFDLVIVYLGYNLDKEYIDAASKVYVMSDYSMTAKNFLSNIPLPKDGKCQMLFFDKATPKIKEKTFTFELENGVINEETDPDLVCESDPADLEGYAVWQFDGYRSLSSMSADYKEAICNIVADYYDEKTSNVAKAVKKI